MLRFLSHTAATVIIMAMLTDLFTRGMFGMHVED